MAFAVPSPRDSRESHSRRFLMRHEQETRPTVRKIQGPGFEITCQCPDGCSHQFRCVEAKRCLDGATKEADAGAAEPEPDPSCCGGVHGVCCPPRGACSDCGPSVSCSLACEAFREYEFTDPGAIGGRQRYRIERPVRLFRDRHGMTERVVDARGVSHCVPAPGVHGCVVRFQSKAEPTVSVPGDTITSGC